MRIFQEEIFGPVVSVTRFTDFDDALAIANDTLYGLGAGVWSRDANTCYRMGRGQSPGPGQKVALREVYSARRIWPDRSSQDTPVDVTRVSSDSCL